MVRSISCSGHKIAEEARKWVGYLEHKSPVCLGLFRENVGKGGHTVFSETVRRDGGRNLQGLPWCAVFVYAVFLRVIGKKQARRILGHPHARAKNLARSIWLRGLWRPYLRDAVVGDIVFYANDGKHIDHCGIIVETDGHQYFTAVEGNAVDDSGHFEREHGGAVSYRHRHCCDKVIIGYGAVTRRFENGDL